MRHKQEFAFCPTSVYDYHRCTARNRALLVLVLVCLMPTPNSVRFLLFGRCSLHLMSELARHGKINISCRTPIIVEGHIMENDLVSTIIANIVPASIYKPATLAPLLGVSRSCVYRLIGNGSIHAYYAGKHRRLMVTGERAIDFCRYHADYLEMYSSFGKRAKRVKPKPYMLKRRKAHREKRNLLELRADVFSTCDHLQKYYGHVTVRTVKPLVTGKTEHVCRYVRQWKRRKSGMKPVKKTA